VLSGIAFSASIQIEINFLMRVCGSHGHYVNPMPFGDEPACESPVLAIVELFAGKIRAMIDRQHPPDLYDLSAFAKLL